jgi:hypothetical protein
MPGIASRKYEGGKSNSRDYGMCPDFITDIQKKNDGKSIIGQYNSLRLPNQIATSEIMFIRGIADSHTTCLAETKV